MIVNIFFNIKFFCSVFRNIFVSIERDLSVSIKFVSFFIINQNKIIIFSWFFDHL